MSDVGEIGAALPAGPLTGTATANLNATGGLRRRELSAGQSVHESARVRVCVDRVHTCACVWAGGVAVHGGRGGGGREADREGGLTFTFILGDCIHQQSQEGEETPCHLRACAGWCCVLGTPA